MRFVAAGTVAYLFHRKDETIEIVLPLAKEGERKNMLKRWHVLLLTGGLLILVLALPASATKLAGEFLSTGYGAKALSMGGAFVSVANDASSAYWNPAGLVQLEKSQLLLMHSERFGDLIDYNCIGLARPLGGKKGKEAAGGLTIIWLRVSDIALTSHLNTPGVDFEDLDGDGRWDPGEERRFWRPDRVRWESDNELAALLSYAQRRNENLSLGFTGKLIWKDVAGISCLGFGFDAGLLYNLTDQLSIGVNLQDITTTPLYWSGWYDTVDSLGTEYRKRVKTKETIYPTAKVGASYEISSSKIPGTVIIAADIDFKFEGLGEEADFSFSEVSGDVRLGVLYDYKGIFHVAAGMDRKKPTAGIGVTLSRLGVGYAFWRDTELDNTHRISLEIYF